MNLSRNWLADFVDVSDIENKAYCDRMTDTGSKVEGFEVLAEDIENVVVGRILAIAKHENSDHLQICSVDVGEDAPVQIVTGAQNIFEGAVIPVAKAYSKLPGGVTIKPGKLRGVESNGMLCSIGELGLTTHDMPTAIEDGIFIMDASLEEKIGTDIREVLMLSDSVVEFEITPNRPDCLSVIGLARETAASFDRALNIPTPKVTEVGGDIADYLKVKIDAPELCPRYTARVVKNVKIEPSPLWMRMRLRAAGVRPINNIVDITNYVMLEYGQPMHAFDYACIDGSAITVRTAAEGENFKSLDDKDHVLDTGMLVIADDKKAVALAGVMGGANSEITENTKTVVFESANFYGASIRITSRKLGMRTESSGRFEKGLDRENTFAALERACELVNLLGAGEVVSGIVDVYPGKKDATVIKLEPERINKFLGINASEQFMRDTLKKLDFTLDGDMVTVPSFREDVEGMQDLAEEVVRIYGYNEIESTGISGNMTQGQRSVSQNFEVGLHKLLLGIGLDEICTFSFISPKYYDKICLPADSAKRNSIVIKNPLGEDTSVMRTTALPSIMEVLARNANFSNEKVGLYEIATTYTPTDTEGGKLPDERKVLTLGFYGRGDFFTLKQMCETVAKYARVKVEYVRDSENPSYHPGRCANILLADGTRLGTMGQIHPAAAANYDMDMPVFVAEIDIPTLFANRGAEPEYKHLPKFPASSRDFSFVCDEALEVGAIEKVMYHSGVKLLEDVKLVDIYRGVQVGEGKKSVTFRIILRSADRTLTVEEADKAAKKILGNMERQLGITIRQ
ncbi:MAG: phenylalanine--tRNA ligase subunit beta [Clostridia bacterium]|nr:phenylalanine--tRNA ligase subunit beta [Clostridia bacterium]